MKLKIEESLDKDVTLLNEDVTIDQAARQVDAEETVVTGEESQIERALNRSLKRALSMRGDEGDFPNVLLVGDAGFGKTAIVKQWAKANNVNLVYKDAKTMNAADLGGMIARDADSPRHTTRLGSTEFSRSLSKPRSVLFLDEYNRAKSEIRGALLTLIQEHIVWNPDSEGEQEYLPNFLFTIAAINPANNAYPGARILDPAERSRFKRVPIKPDAAEHLRYLTRFYNDKIAKEEDPEENKALRGRLKLAQTLLSSPDFYYDTSEEVEDNVDDDAYVPLNYRSLKQALDDSNGTKEDFLAVWNEFCNYKKKKLVSDILKEYVEVDDKATQAISGESTSSVFSKAKTAREKLLGVIPTLKI